VLVHHPDARVDGIARRAHAQHVPVHHDLALVRRVQAVQDVHECGLARAVLAQEGVHFPLGQLEVDGGVGHQAAEALGDSPELEERCVGHD
jgi:hypothetical protein